MKTAFSESFKFSRGVKHQFRIVFRYRYQSFLVMAGEFLLKKLRMLQGLKWINLSPGHAKIWTLQCIILFQLGWPKPLGQSHDVPTRWVFTWYSNKLWTALLFYCTKCFLPTYILLYVSDLNNIRRETIKKWLVWSTGEFMCEHEAINSGCAKVRSLQYLQKWQMIVLIFLYWVL